METLLRLRKESRKNASPHGRRDGKSDSKNKENTEKSPQRKKNGTPPLAHDRPQVPEGLDRSENRRWPRGWRIFPRPPDSPAYRRATSRTPADARRLAAWLSSGRAVRW